jgi:hypothetical protein
MNNYFIPNARRNSWVSNMSFFEGLARMGGLYVDSSSGQSIPHQPATRWVIKVAYPEVRNREYLDKTNSGLLSDEMARLEMSIGGEVTRQNLSAQPGFGRRPLGWSPPERRIRTEESDESNPNPKQCLFLRARIFHIYAALWQRRNASNVAQR